MFHYWTVYLLVGYKNQELGEGEKAGNGDRRNPLLAKKKGTQASHSCA